jgi:dGTPase
VAQVGRGIAEKLQREAKRLGAASGLNIDPDVVEAACLAHDIGHPPFGHIAEKELDAIARVRGLSDGFEGNAQSFRIVTRLAMGSTENGLNLTRATLNAILKYPWRFGQNPSKRDKWGCYEDDMQMLSWARQVGPEKNLQSSEARLMDWSDDVTYSVHDVDDFYRAGVIPLDRLVVDSEERERFYKGVFARRRDKLPKDMDELFLRGAFDSLMSVLNVREPYTPTRKARVRLRQVTSTLIRNFVNAVQLNTSAAPPGILIENRRRAEIFMLKQLTWHYVIKNPALATQQHGQRVIIRQLFNAFYKGATRKELNVDFFPISLQELLPSVPVRTSNDRKKLARAIIDFIASLTEEQAIATHHRIYGVKLGSSLVFQVR